MTFEKRIERAQKEIKEKYGENPTPYELGEYAYTNYQRLTRDPQRERDAEQDFHDAIYELADIYKMDMNNFQEGWNDAAEAYSN